MPTQTGIYTHGRRRHAARHCWRRHWNATSGRALARGRAGSGRSWGPLASVLARAGPGTGQRAAGTVSPRPRGRCHCWWPRDWPTVRGQAAVHLSAHREHPPAARARHAGRTEPGCARRRGASLDRALSSPLGWEVACAPFGRGGARRLVEWPGCAPGCLPSGRPSPWAGHRVHRAWVGDRRAARIAGSIPARAPMSRAAARPPAQASGGMMVAQPLCRA